MMADVFFIQMRRLRSFRRGAAVTTEDCRWFYKSRAKATSRGRRKTEQDREKKRAKQREKTQQNRGKKPSKTEKENTQKKKQRKHNTKPRPKFERRSQHRPQCFIARIEKAGKNKKRKGTAGTETKEKQEGRL
jgi:sRNA-binding protein